MFVVNLTANELLTAGVAGAIVVLSGGLYALFLALSKMYGRSRDSLLAYSNYLLLCIAFGALSKSLHLNFAWNLVVIFLLAGYLVSPHVIWKLTQVTHRIDTREGSQHE